MTKMEDFKFWLFEFCRRLAEEAANRDELDRKARELAEREELTYRTALVQLVERGEVPEYLVFGPSLSPKGNPDFYLDRQMQTAIARGWVGSEAEALTWVVSTFPQIAQLAEIKHRDYHGFREACRKVGGMDPDFARERVVELILAEYRRLKGGS